MIFQKAITVLAFCVVSCLATYEHNYHGHHGGGGHGKVHVDNQKIHLDGPKIHLDNPRIILDRPSIHVKDNGGHLHEDEPIILENDKPLYIRKTLHGIPSGHATGPIFINGGGHGHGYGYGGKAGAAVVLAPTHIISAAPAAVTHDAAILIRRPVHVSKELAPTQDHLEKLHFEKLSHGGYGNGGYSHGGGYAHGGGYGHGGGYAHGGGYGHGGGYSHGHSHIVSAIPISKGLQENTVVYEKAEPVGHGLISFSAYHAPSVFVGQPRAIYGLGNHGHVIGGGFAGGKDSGYGHGHGHGHGGGYKKY